MVVTVRSLGLTGIRGSEVTVECFLSGVSQVIFR